MTLGLIVLLASCGRGTSGPVEIEESDSEEELVTEQETEPSEPSEDDSETEEESKESDSQGGYEKPSIELPDVYFDE